VTNIYDERYRTEESYWGKRPSDLCLRVLALHPPVEPTSLLDIGCGEGRNAVFFARNGYSVTAFDLSPRGIEKTMRLAKEAGAWLTAFTADILEYRPDREFDIVFSTGSLHYIPEELRAEILGSYKRHTRPGGLNAFSVLVEKPFIPPAPDTEPTAHAWISGEVFTHYHDWIVEHCCEEIFDCSSSGAPHRHAVNRIVARRPRD